MTDSLVTVVARLGLTISAVFVPFSKSRNAKPGVKLTDRSLNWTVTVHHNGRAVLSTDYMAGIAHCPSYPRAGLVHGFSVDTAEALNRETESGLSYKRPGFRTPIMPDAVDVLASLAMDASAIDHATFEDWAADYGYDTDSRKAEATYRQCLSHALALRNALGDAALCELRDAAAEH